MPCCACCPISDSTRRCSLGPLRCGFDRASQGRSCCLVAGSGRPGSRAGRCPGHFWPPHLFGGPVATQAEALRRGAGSGCIASTSSPMHSLGGRRHSCCLLRTEDLRGCTVGRSLRHRQEHQLMLARAPLGAAPEVRDPLGLGGRTTRTPYGAPRAATKKT